MVSLPPQIRKTIKKYLEELKKNNIPVDEVILFGSYARGDYHEYSDIDLLLVSPIFKGKRIEDKDKIREITLKISSAIEILPCSREQFENKDPLIEEIVKTGIKISVN